MSVVTIREHVPLSGYTTLRLGGPARRFAEAATEAQIIAQVRAADERGEPLLVLGGGSNLVVADDGFPGTVVRVCATGIRVVPARVTAPGAAWATARDGVPVVPGDAPPAVSHDPPPAHGGGHAAGSGHGPAGPPSAGAVSVTVAAGQDWDAFVAWSVGEGLAGLECLSGIPGLAGATPIQNVGAYGQEVSGAVTAVRAYDRATGSVLELPPARCGFGYRTSAFKRETAGRPGAVTGRFVVLAVTFRLLRIPPPGQRGRPRDAALSAPVRYRELARALAVAEGERAPLAEVRAAVLRLRRAKGMVLDPADPDTRSAGSFFTNPVLSEAEFAGLERAAGQEPGGGPAVPRFPAGEGRVKVPAAWLIEHAGFGKGYPGLAPAGDGPPAGGSPAGGSPAGGSPDGAGAARISAKHTLALVNPGGASAASLVALAREIRDGVRKTFGVDLAPEPVLVGTAL